MEDYTMKSVVFTVLSVAGLIASAATFPDWQGIEQKNYISGRMVSASDLRHKVAVVIEIDNDDKLAQNMKLADKFETLSEVVLRNGSWETLRDEDFPRSTISFVSIFGKKPKPSQLSRRSKAVMPVYHNVKLVGVDYDKTERKRPYAYVFSAEGGESIWKGELTEASVDAVRKAVNSAKKKVPAWTPLTGISDLSALPDVAKYYKSGKIKNMTAAAMAAIKSKDPEISRQGQIVYDAIEQYKSDLLFRISIEFTVSPVKAYADAQRLVKLFPSEKKKLVEFDAFLSKNREVATLGKMMEKALLLRDPMYNPKPAQLKADIQMLKKWQNLLKLMAKEADVTYSGQMLLLSSILEDLISEASSRISVK
jgi:hypothetical protein